jgi:uncharacterized Fe-S radical SAM superfamily protein PflX
VHRYQALRHQQQKGTVDAQVKTSVEAVIEKSVPPKTLKKKLTMRTSSQDSLASVHADLWAMNESFKINQRKIENRRQSTLAHQRIAMATYVAAKKLKKVVAQWDCSVNRKSKQILKSMITDQKMLHNELQHMCQQADVVCAGKLDEFDTVLAQYQSQLDETSSAANS